MSKNKRILMIVTSHGQIAAGNATGLWFEEFAAPFALFRKQGYAVTVASVKGGALRHAPALLQDRRRRL